MVNTIFWGIINAYSGGIIYNSIKETMSYSNTTLTYRDSPFEVQNYLNWGFIFGMSIGLIRGYYGKPVMQMFIIDPKK